MMYGMGGGLGLLTWVIVMADFILAGIWLYQQVTKK